MAYQYEYPHPAVTTDSVIFTIREERLHVLLIQRGRNPEKGYWAFPGGFIEIDEDLDAGVRRELQEETGLTGIELRQFYTFGSPKRDPRERVITVAYLALIASDNVQPKAADDAVDANWFSIDDLPALAFDHDSVLALAHAHLVAHTTVADLAGQFVPMEFSILELARIYSILGRRDCDLESLRLRLLALGQLEACAKTRIENDAPIELYRAIQV